MTRIGWPTAVLAAALAFGVGYAVRLACAWSAGSLRVVETQEIAGPTAGAAAASGGSPVGTTPSAPRPPVDAVDPARDDATPSATNSAPADDVFCRALYDVFARKGRTAEFRRIIDKAAVVPLGRSPADLGLLDAGVSAPAPLVESVPDLRRRISPVNAADGRPPMRRFQFAAFRRGARFEVVLGDAGLPMRLDPTSEARAFAARAGKTLPGPWPQGRDMPALASDQADALLHFCADSFRGTEAARRGLWTRLRGLAASGAASPLDPRDVVGVCIAGDRCVVLHVGDDPELDRLVDEADRQEREASAEVEQELRR